MFTPSYRPRGCLHPRRLCLLEDLNLPTVNCLCCCLFGDVFISSFLSSFDGYGILSVRVFSFNTLNVLYHCFLGSRVPSEKAADSLSEKEASTYRVGFPLLSRCTVFTILLLTTACLVRGSLSMCCWGFAELLACRGGFSLNLGGFGHYFSKESFCPAPLSSSRTPIMCAHWPLRPVCFFFILFSVSQTGPVELSSRT